MPAPSHASPSAPSAQVDARDFGRLLRRWRDTRGLTQRALAVVADVSPRHVSFLESGRARPSRAMAIELGLALELPIVARNELLEAAGFARAWRDEARGGGIDRAIVDALERMMAVHEPYPLIVMDRAFDVLRVNGGATRLFSAFIGERIASVLPLNVLTILFDPSLLRPHVVDWERTAALTLAHARHEALRHPEDRRLAARLHALTAFGVPLGFPDAQEAAPPAFVLRLEKGAMRAAFLTTLTTFNAPETPAVEDLRIESYFPLDEATMATCRALSISG